MKKFKKASDIKVGVIGYGGAYNMGKHHLDEMRKAGMTPVAVAELDKERLKVAENDFPGIQTYSSVAEMLKKSDVSVIAIITPHNTHAKLALQCLKAGKSVCCEKPLAITTAECDANPKNKDRGWLEITGTKGTYVFDFFDYKIITPLKKSVKIIKGTNPEAEGWRLYQNLADHLVKREKLVISGEWARRPIHILDLANKSALSGKTLKAKYK